MLRPPCRRITVCRALLLIIGLRSPALAESPSSTEPYVPTLSESDRQFLSRLARRTVRDRVLRQTRYQPEFVPDSLAWQRAECVLRLRMDGFLSASGAGSLGPVAESVLQAAYAAAETIAIDPKARELLPDLLIEIEVLGPSQPLPPELDWTDASKLKPYVEPGIHGLELIRPGGTRRILPSDVFTTDVDLEAGLKALAQFLHHSPAEVAETRVARFRVVHWYEAKGDHKTVLLERGLRLVRPDEVTPQSLQQAIVDLGDYLIYRQRGSGLFSYQFDAGQDQFSPEDNLLRQLYAAVVMARYARTSGQSAPLTAADRAIQWHLQGLTDLAVDPPAGFVATSDGKNKLGVTALLALALIEHPSQAQYAESRDKLISGILTLQQPPGLFLTAFPPARELAGQDHFPGEALLALATEFEQRPNERILDAVDRAIEFYREYFRARRSSAFVPWQVQAFARMAKQSRRSDFAEFAFELMDWQLQRQLGPGNCPWSDLWGGFDSGEGPTAASAAYLEALVDAHFLARKFGDDERAARYLEAIRDAARFVLQLQIRPEEAYFMRSPRNAVGGIRMNPARASIRIDHCAHGLSALMGAQKALFAGDD